MTWAKPILLYAINRTLRHGLIGLAITWGFAALVILTVGYKPIDAVCVVDSWDGKEHLTYSEACEIDWAAFFQLTAYAAAKLGLIAAIAGECAAFLIWFATKIDRPKQVSSQLSDLAGVDDNVS